MINISQEKVKTQNSENSAKNPNIPKVKPYL